MEEAGEVFVHEDEADEDEDDRMGV